MLDIDISFFRHILPQLISTGIIILVFWKAYSFFTQTKLNRYTLGNFCLAALFLLYGKMSLFLLSSNPDVVKYHVDVSLMVYFFVVSMTATRLSGVPKRFQIWLQIILLPLLAAFFDPSYKQGYLIMSADIYLAALAFTWRSKSKRWFIPSFILLGFINAFTAYHNDFYDWYAYLEIIGQFLFLLGVVKLTKEHR